MARLNLTLSATVVVLSTAVVCPSEARAQQAVQLAQRPVFQTASAAVVGAITGTVTDEHGGALPGAMVSVLGATMAMDVTDARGRFALDKLPAGEYILRAHLQGFVASRREVVRILGSALPAVFRIQLRRLDGSVGTSGAGEPLPSRPILLAGFELPRVESADGSADADGASKDDHSHGETAWRIRHLPRNILKDSANTVAVAEGNPPPAGESFFGRSTNPAGGLAASIFDGLPFSGEVNLLTTGAFAPGGFLSGDGLPRGVAYLSIGAPTGAGDWAVRAAMGEGDLSSWIVAGSFVSRRGAIHSYDFGLSYSTQEYQGGSPLALAVVTGGNRNVGELYGNERWTFVPGVTFEYGGRFARYDYLVDRDLVSPHAGITLAPTKATRVTAVLAQRMVAPGAEEFLSSGAVGPWLPPERTFAPLQGNDLRVERARTLDVAVEHDFAGSYVVGVHRFFDAVDDQLVTLFGLNVPGGRRSIGHYYVANGGKVDAEGWAVRVASPSGKRIRGSVNYSLARARWSERTKAQPLVAWAPAAVRPELERVQDVTTTFETDIPETATRVFLLYKINTGFTRSDLSLQRPGLDARFDLQVNQALPFGLLGTRWEVLIGLRNLFRDPTDPASMYDELLVVRPPKRVVGGFLVRF